MEKSEHLLQFWAKKSKSGSEEHHPLLSHMLDVAWVTSALWDTSLHRSTREFLAKALGLPEEEAGWFIAFLAALHDIGKCSPAFQRLSPGAMTALEAQGYHFRRYASECRHGPITMFSLVHDSLPCLSANQTDPDFVHAIALALGGHHGIFPVQTPSVQQYGDKNWQLARRQLAEEVVRLLGIQKTSLLHTSANKAFYIVLAGLVSVADWIGSSEKYFPYQVETQPVHTYSALSRKRAGEALSDIGWSNFSPPVSTIPFVDLFGIERPWPVQRAVINLTDDLQEEPALVLIEAPMGEGKTEAAMYLADHWAVRLGQKGCYFALPTKASSNQMFSRVAEFLQNRYKDSEMKLQLVHGGALLDDRLADLQIETSADDGKTQNQERSVAEEWFRPTKRGLLAPFGVGTIDQSLLSVLQTRHFFVRLFGLAHKTVIVDEVHAYDTYMSTLLETVICWLRALGSPIVMLSATLPKEKRLALISAFGTAPESQGASYPRITWVSASKAGALHFDAVSRRELRLIQVRDDLKEVTDQLRTVLRDGGCVAVVCNTVKRAQDTYTFFKNAGLVEPHELSLLHARFPFEERDVKEAVTVRAFGRNGKRPQRAILVATQIIEQSLDLDFDLMITDFAPADLVLQRAGRIHRHQQPNPRAPAVSSPAIWVRMPSVDREGLPDFGASARVYERYHLLRSYLSLKDRERFVFPEDIEAIVEEAYGPMPNGWPSEAFKNTVLKAKEDMDSEISMDKNKAVANMIKRPDSPGTAWEYLSNFNKGLEEDNPDINQWLQALTRLAEPSVQVVCLDQRPGGTFLTEIGSEPIEIDRKPTNSQVQDLLKRSLTISDKRVVFELLEKGEQPQPWKTAPALRHHRLLRFEKGHTRVGRHVLALTKELGLSIEEPDNQRKEEAS